MEDVNCDYCGSGEAIFVAKQSDKLHHTTDELFNIVKCCDCGLNYTNPRPSTSEIGRYYSEEYSFHAVPSSIKKLVSLLVVKVINGPFSVLVNTLPFISSKFIPYVKPIISDPVIDYYKSSGAGDFLDIGCGAGSSAHFWNTNGALVEYRKLFKVAGIEVSDRARKVLSEEGIENWAGLDLVPKNRRFGMIRMNWSLEHVHSPTEYFSFIRNHLLPGGRVIIAVPNYDGLIYKVAPDCVELPIHLYHFRPVDIRNYALRFGFKVRSLQTFSYPQMYISASKAGLLADSFKEIMTLKAAKSFQLITKMFDEVGCGNDMLVELELDS